MISKSSISSSDQKIIDFKNTYLQDHIKADNNRSEYIHYLIENGLSDTVMSTYLISYDSAWWRKDDLITSWEITVHQKNPAQMLKPNVVTAEYK